jgi:2,4-dienoyl-CoA reductase-like NADH-dependent reductase (Old Yellow Enzyme family)
MSKLFEEISIRGVTFPNRIGISPMCQYSAVDGYSNDWHLVHLGSRAAGGAGLIIVEATAVSPEGRITPQDLGLWKDDHIEGLKRITRFVKSQGTRIGIQLAHAGRKGSDPRPWDTASSYKELQDGWQPVGPSAIAFSDETAPPRALTEKEVSELPQLFAKAAKRAIEAGFEFIELHAAHGYLLHEFLSPISNKRQDRYGGSFENRIRIVQETVTAVRNVIPAGMPLFMRISAKDWLPGGWTLEESVQLAKIVKDLGVDLIDTSSGAIAPGEDFPRGKDYQVDLSEVVKRESGILTAAVGRIRTPDHANEIVSQGKADIVLIARESLRDPYWTNHAAKALTKKPFRLPDQYSWAIGEDD